MGDGKLVLTEAEEIKPKLPDDDDIPFNLGGRVGLFKGAEADARAGRGAMSPGTSTSGGGRGGGGGGRSSTTNDGPRPHEDFPISPTVADMGGPPRLTTSPTHVPKKEPKWGKTKTFLKTILPFVTPKTLIFSQFPKKAHIGLGALKGIKEIHELYSTPDEEETPGPAPLYATGGRVGLKYGTKKLFNFTKKQLLDAVNDIFPTGDRKYDAEMVGDALVENNPKMFQNRLRQDLNDSEYSEIYGIALDALDAFNAEARELMKGTKRGWISYKKS